MDHRRGLEEDGGARDEDAYNERPVDGLAGLREFHAAAAKLLESFGAETPQNRGLREVQVATFAAFEAKRDLAAKPSWFATCFYSLFLIATAFSPIFVASFEPAERGVVWDAFSIGSTMLLLYSTYGYYTAKMVKGWIKVIFSKVKEDSDNGMETAAAFVLLGAGSLFAYWAYLDLWVLHKMITVAHESSIFAEYYWDYFTWIFALSGLFVLMDWTVATFNESHSDTYIAASSTMYVTVPMATGIGLVWAYLWAEYCYASWWLPGSDPWQSLSVEFASGALTFQMIISNVLFILIKKNMIFRFFYNSIHSTRRG